MRALFLMLVLLSAGCTGGPPPPLVPGDPVLGEGTPPDFAGPPLLVYETLAEAAFMLAPAQQARVPATIPNGTLAVFANLTLTQGSAYSIQAQLGECQWRRDLAFVAQGQEVVVDCGGVLAGAETLAIDTQAGALSGTVRIVALVCHASSGCPGRLPVSDG